VAGLPELGNIDSKEDRAGIAERWPNQSRAGLFLRRRGQASLRIHLIDLQGVRLRQLVAESRLSRECGANGRLLQKLTLEQNLSAETISTGRNNLVSRRSTELL